MNGHDLSITRVRYNTTGRARCNACTYVRSAKWREENKDRIPTLMRECNLRRAYGIGIKDVETLLQSQGGKCATCLTDISNHLDKSFGVQAVDHDHSTGAIRGILCKSCNMTLGLVKDSPETLSRMVDYLLRAKIGIAV